MVDQPRSPPNPKPRIKGTLSLPPVAPGMNKRAPQDKPPDPKGATSPTSMPPDTSSDLKTEDDVKLLERIKKRVDNAVQTESDQRKAMVDDLKFKAGIQWPADVAAQRATDKRPCMTINLVPSFVHQVTNSQRENRPTINVSPVGDKGDKDAAKMYRGLIRHIERQSRADIAYDTAFDNSVSNGLGFIRLLTEWESDDSFDQTIVIKRIRNPLTVYLDPFHQEPDGADSRWGAITEIIPEEDFKEEYPDAQIVPFTEGGTGEKYRSWSTRDGVRVAEYYEVVNEPAELVSLSNGYVGYEDELDDLAKQKIKNGAFSVLDRRDSFKRSVKYYKVTAIEILERKDWLGKWIPIIPVIGNEIDIEGKVSLSGLIRDAKDPQRFVNYWNTMEAELVALAPKAPFIMEEGQVEGHERQWKVANTRSFPYLLYKGTNVGGRPAPPPQRQAATQVPAGVVQAKEGAMKNLMATTGIRFDPNAQPADLRESGRLVQEQRRNADIGAYHFIDNLGRSLKQVGDQLIDLIPKLYDRKRVMTILREDDTEEQVTLDPLAGKAYDEKQTNSGTMKIFNPKMGKYGVTVDIGPSYATKRIEAAQSMLEFAKILPNTAALIADLIAKYQDWNGSEEMAARLAKAIPPQLLTPEQKDMSPQVQALIQGHEKNIQQLSQQLQAAMHALDDKQKDRDVALDKIQKDFEAKILAVMQKSEDAAQKLMLEQVRLVVEEVRAEKTAATAENRADINLADQQEARKQETLKDG